MFYMKKKKNKTLNQTFEHKAWQRTAKVPSKSNHLVAIFVTPLGSYFNYAKSALVCQTAWQYFKYLLRCLKICCCLSLK